METEESHLPTLPLDQLLTENMLLISAIHECRAAGHDEQGSQYALRLHKNLMTISQKVEHQKTLKLRQRGAASDDHPPTAGPANDNADDNADQ